jgi:hypothetical protein
MPSRVGVALCNERVPARIPVKRSREPVPATEKEALDVMLLSRTSPARCAVGHLEASAGAAGALSQAVGGAAARVLTPLRLAQGRTGIGVTMVTRPAAVSRALGVDRVSAERSGWAVQMLGAREVALGAGAWIALRRGDERSTRLWLAAGLLCDAVDAVVMAGAVGRGRVHPAAGSAVAAVATTAAGIQTAALTADH